MVSSPRKTCRAAFAFAPRVVCSRTLERLLGQVGLRAQDGMDAAARGATSEGFEHRGHQAPREGLAHPIPGLLLRSKKAAGVVADVGLFAGGEALARPDRLLAPTFR